MRFGLIFADFRRFYLAPLVIAAVLQIVQYSVALAVAASSWYAAIAAQCGLAAVVLLSFRAVQSTLAERFGFRGSGSLILFSVVTASVGVLFATMFYADFLTWDRNTARGLTADGELGAAADDAKHLVFSDAVVRLDLAAASRSAEAQVCRRDEPPSYCRDTFICVAPVVPADGWSPDDDPVLVWALCPSGCIGTTNAASMTQQADRTNATAVVHGACGDDGLEVGWCARGGLTINEQTGHALYCPIEAGTVSSDIRSTSKPIEDALVGYALRSGPTMDDGDQNGLVITADASYDDAQASRKQNTVIVLVVMISLWFLLSAAFVVRRVARESGQYARELDRTDAWRERLAARRTNKQRRAKRSAGAGVDFADEIDVIEFNLNRKPTDLGKLSEDGSDEAMIRHLAEMNSMRNHKYFTLRSRSMEAGEGRALQNASASLEPEPLPELSNTTSESDSAASNTDIRIDISASVSDATDDSDASTSESDDDESEST